MRSASAQRKPIWWATSTKTTISAAINRSAPRKITPQVNGSQGQSVSEYFGWRTSLPSSIPQEVVVRVGGSGAGPKESANVRRSY